MTGARLKLRIPLAALGVLCAAACAADPVDTEALLGSYVSPVWNRSSHRTFNYSLFSLREDWPLGWAGRTFPDWDWVGELYAGDVTSGFAHEIDGASLLARRWLRPAGEAARTYLQAGFGPLYSDAYRNRQQLQLGEALEFKSTVAFGLRVRLARDWSWFAELAYNHFSDAGLSSRNFGVNALGVNAGLVGWRF